MVHVICINQLYTFCSVHLQCNVGKTVLLNGIKNDLSNRYTWFCWSSALFCMVL